MHFIAAACCCKNKANHGIQFHLLSGRGNQTKKTKNFPSYCMNSDDFPKLTSQPPPPLPHTRTEFQYIFKTFQNWKTMYAYIFRKTYKTISQAQTDPKKYRQIESDRHEGGQTHRPRTYQTLSQSILDAFLSGNNVCPTGSRLSSFDRQSV